MDLFSHSAWVSMTSVLVRVFVRCFVDIVRVERRCSVKLVCDFHWTSRQWKTLYDDITFEKGLL